MSGEPSSLPKKDEAEAPARKARGVSFFLRMAAGLGVSLFFVWLSLRGSDLGSVADGLREADYRWVAACIGLLLVAHVFRAARWGLLLSPHGSFSLGHLNRAAAVGFMALLILPMRLGELGRPWLMSQPDPGRRGKSPLPMSAAMGTLVFERIADGILLTGLLFLLLTFVPPATTAAGWLQAGAGLLALAFLTMAGLAWVACRHRDRTSAVLGRVAGVFGERVGGWIASGSALLMGGLTGPRPGAARPGYALLTLGFWAVDVLAIQVLARAFGIELNFAQSLVVLGTQVVGVMIPAGPGMLGTYQYFTILGVSFFVSPDVAQVGAVALANVLWACIFVQQVGLGLLFLPRRERVLSRLAGGEVERQVELAAEKSDRDAA